MAKKKETPAQLAKRLGKPQVGHFVTLLVEDGKVVFDKEGKVCFCVLDAGIIPSEYTPEEVTQLAGELAAQDPVVTEMARVAEEYERGEQTHKLDNTATFTDNGVKRTINLDDPDSVSPEDISRLGEAFRRMFEAEAGDRDFDMREMAAAPPDAVEEAVKAFTERVGKSAPVNEWLMGRILPANTAYRDLTGTPSTSVDHVFEDRRRDFPSMFIPFEDDRGAYGHINKEAVERKARALDSELSDMSSVDREEMIYQFTSGFLQPALTGWYAEVSPYSEQFNGLSDGSKKLMRDLLQLYDQITVDLQCLNEVLGGYRGFGGTDKALSEKRLQSLITLQESSPRGVGFPRGQMERPRLLSMEEFAAAMDLSKALYLLLPLKFAQETAADIVTEIGVPTNVNGRQTFYNKGDYFLGAGLIRRFDEHAKYVRNAFLALSRTRGNFEPFVTALVDYHTQVSQETRQRMAAAAALVRVFDTVGLEIPKTLQESKKRLLDPYNR